MLHREEKHGIPEIHSKLSIDWKLYPRHILYQTQDQELNWRFKKMERRDD